MEHKILFTGTMGVGKTTAIAQISTTPPISTDVANTRRDENTKATTTAAFDYGEIDLGDGEFLRLYGTPGQERFRFMWPVLARGALGVVYLVDCTREDPLSDLELFIDAFGQSATDLPSVVALNKIPSEPNSPVKLFQEYLEDNGMDWPVVSGDVRQQDYVLYIIEILLSLIEVKALEMD